MSVTAIAWAKRQKTGDATWKHVLAAVADYADEDGICWPSQERLARDTELSARSIRRALKGLEEAGFLSRQKRFSRPGANRQSDVLKLHFNQPANLSASGKPCGHTDQTMRTECPPNHHMNRHLLIQEGKVSKGRGKLLRERGVQARLDATARPLKSEEIGF